jgi:hypothetical protein
MLRKKPEGFRLPSVFLLPAITEKGKQLTIVSSRFAWVGLLGCALVITGLVGCDSASTPPNEPSPTIPKQEAPAGNGGKAAPKSIKNRPQGPEAKS